MEFAAAFGSGISSLLAEVLRSTPETAANTPPTAEILIASPVGSPVAAPHRNTGFTPDVLEGLMPPVVQLAPDPTVPIWFSVENPALAIGIEVIGAGNVN